MKKQCFQWLTLFCLIILALATRWGDTVIFMDDWWFAAAVAVLFAAFCIWWLPAHRPARLSLDWTALLFIGTFLLLALLSPYRYGAQVEMAKLGAAFLLAFMVLNLVQDRQDLQFYLSGLLALGVGMALIAFLYYIAALSPALATSALHLRNLYVDHFVESGQIWGLWEYPNTYAGFVDLCLLLALGMAAEEKQRGQRLVYDACAAFLLMILYLTGSRGAFLTAFIGAVALLLLTPRSARWRMLLRMLGTGLVAAIAVVADPLTKTTTAFNIGKSESMGKFISGQGNTSLQTRFHMMHIAARIFAKHPLAGSGLGTFGQQWTATEWRLDNARRIDPHSFFFRFLAETGLLGTVPLFAWIARRLAQGLRFPKDAPRDMGMAGLWAGTLAFLLHMCVDVDYVYAVVPAILFFCLALIAARAPAVAAPQQAEEPLPIGRRLTALVAGGLALCLAVLPLAQRGIGSIYATEAEGRSVTEQVTMYSIATVWDPGNDIYWNSLGSDQSALLRGGVSGTVTAAARTALRTAITLAPGDYRPWWNLGMLEINLKDPDAVTCLEKAEQLYPTLAGIKGWLALAYIYAGGESAKAQAMATQTFVLAPQQAYALAAQGFCALKQGDPQRAMQLFTSAIRYDGANRFAFFGLSLCYRAAGNTAAERAQLQLSQDVNPNLVEAMARLRALMH